MSIKNRKKKILFVITHLELGGAQKQLLSLVRNLDKEKYSLSLYAGKRGYLINEFLNTSGLKVTLSVSLVREINPFLDILEFCKLLFFIRKNRFDIVHVHCPKASILGRWAAHFAGLKNIIYTAHGWPFHKFMHPFLYKFYLFLEKLTAKITKKIIVVSKADLKEAVNRNLSSPDKFFTSMALKGLR